MLFQYQPRPGTTYSKLKNRRPTIRPPQNSTELPNVGTAGDADIKSIHPHHLKIHFTFFSDIICSALSPDTSLSLWASTNLSYSNTHRKLKAALLYSPYPLTPDNSNHSIHGPWKSPSPLQRPSGPPSPRIPPYTPHLHLPLIIPGTISLKDMNSPPHPYNPLEPFPQELPSILF